MGILLARAIGDSRAIVHIDGARELAQSIYLMIESDDGGDNGWDEVCDSALETMIYLIAHLKGLL